MNTFNISQTVIILRKRSRFSATSLMGFFHKDSAVFILSSTKATMVTSYNLHLGKGFDSQEPDSTQIYWYVWLPSPCKFIHWGLPLYKSSWTYFVAVVVFNKGHVAVITSVLIQPFISLSIHTHRGRCTP